MRRLLLPPPFQLEDDAFPQPFPLGRPEKAAELFPDARRPLHPLVCAGWLRNNPNGKQWNKNQLFGRLSCVCGTVLRQWGQTDGHFCKPAECAVLLLRRRDDPYRSIASVRRRAVAPFSECLRADSSNLYMQKRDRYSLPGLMFRPFIL